MKLEKIKDLADALNIFVDELKKSEVTGHQLNIIGELNDEFDTNLSYVKELIVVPEVIPTVDSTVTEEKVPEEKVPSEPLPLPRTEPARCQAQETAGTQYYPRNNIEYSPFH